MFKKTLAFMVSVILAVNAISCIAYAATATDADTAFNEFNNKFYTVSNGNGYYKADTNGGKADFWKEAEMMEMVIDAYQRSGNNIYYNMINELYNGFIAQNTSNWSGNIYNDDIMWMVIFCSRAYEVTGNVTYKNQAKSQFDLVYDRAFDTSLGGGLWWTTDKNKKNACINGPAAIAAYKLYKITGDSAYLQKSKDLYAWLRDNLFNATTGAVNDHKTKTGTVDASYYTYNQGTFIGAANYLYKETGIQSYKTEAGKALDFTINNMTDSAGILKSENATGDQGGFKGIFVRWAIQYIKDNNIASYNAWFQTNADTAWLNRNSSNLMDQNWAVTTGTGTLPSFSCSSAVVLLQLAPFGSAPNAFAKIEAESASTKTASMVIESCAEGGQQLGGIKNGDSAIFSGISFSKSASYFDARVAVDPSAGGVIEVRDGSTSGTLFGTASVSNTGGWSSFTTVSCSVSIPSGTRNICLVFKTDSGKTYVCNLNWIQFR